MAKHELTIKTVKPSGFRRLACACGWVMSGKMDEKQAREHYNAHVLDLSRLTPLELQLYEALDDARAHLDYCGYGDKWERECAQAQGLEGKITAAIAAAEHKLETA